MHAITISAGVRYAEPPTGDLRFRKPVAASWTGEKLAQKAEIICMQYGSSMFSMSIFTRCKFALQYLTFDCESFYLWRSLFSISLIADFVLPGSIPMEIIAVLA